MCADESLLREIVDGAGDAFREATIVHEDERGAVGANQFEELGMDRAPDGWADRALRRGATRERVDVVEARHVFDGNFDAKVEPFFLAGVDDGDGAVDGRIEGGFEFGKGLVGRGRGGLGLWGEIGW